MHTVRHDSVSMGSFLAFVGEVDVLLETDSNVWVNVKRFSFDPGGTDAQLLESLITQAQYGDDYVGEFSEEYALADQHGPYRRSAITPEAFELTEAGSAETELSAWLSNWVDKDAGQAARSRELLQTEVLTLLASGSVYRLPDLRDVAEHEWGCVTGTLGFHEFVVIDRTAGMLSLVVASDD